MPNITNCRTYMDDRISRVAGPPDHVAWLYSIAAFRTFTSGPRPRLGSFDRIFAGGKMGPKLSPLLSPKPPQPCPKPPNCTQPSAGGTDCTEHYESAALTA